MTTLERRAAEAKHLIETIGIDAVHEHWPILAGLDEDRTAAILARFGRLTVNIGDGTKRCPQCKATFPRPIFKGQAYCPNCRRKYQRIQNREARSAVLLELRGLAADATAARLNAQDTDKDNTI